MDGWITIGTKLDTKEFDVQIQALERDLDQMERAYETGIKLGNPQDAEDLQRLEVEIEKTRNKLIQLRREKDKLNKIPTFENMGKSIQRSIKSIGRLILGIFSIRSAYLAVRRAASDLETYDPQFAANLEYIRYVLTQAIAPVLRGIVQLAMQLLNIINTILNALFRYKYLF